MASEPSAVAAIRALLDEEVPAIRSGAVRVRAIAREEGVRVKVAVEPGEPAESAAPGAAPASGADPVQACIGEAEQHLRRIAARLKPEKIDLLRWREDPPVLLANALSPARPRQMHLDAARRDAVVALAAGDPLLTAPDREARLRLAEGLTGWRITIEPEARIDGLE